MLRSSSITRCAGQSQAAPSAVCTPHQRGRKEGLGAAGVASVRDEVGDERSKNQRACDQCEEPDPAIGPSLGERTYESAS